MTDNPYPDIYEELVRVRESGKAAVLVTVISVKGSTPRTTGAKMLVYADGSISGTIGGGIREADIISEARNLLSVGGNRLMEVDFTEGLTSGKGPVCGGVMEVFMERIEPKRRVVISGAGHIGYYLHRILTLLDYKMIIIDPRPELNNSQRFPGADNHVHDFEDGLGSLELDERDSVVLVGPGHEQDWKMLPSVLKSNAGYIGMIGSKRKIREVFDKLRAAGFGGDDIKKIYSPIGLEIGSESPAEIALSIAAEIVKHFNT